MLSTDPSTTVARMGGYRLRSLRWVMVAMICADVGVTLVGQPRRYWHDPMATTEGGPFFAAVMRHGWPAFVATAAACVAGIFLLTKILPQRIALVVILATTLAEYFGATTWVVYYYNFKSTGDILTAITLSIALIKAGLRPWVRSTDA
jgi:hypothetical protein